MVDLAYLNSGAGDGNYARDVDVNFDGFISIADLEAMDDQFGSSLHTSNPLTGPGSSVFVFTGNDGAKISLFEGDGEYGGVQSDDAFIDQNILKIPLVLTTWMELHYSQTALVVLSMIIHSMTILKLGDA